MKPNKPVDRALADVNRQIEILERQLRGMGPAPEPVPQKPTSNFLRRMLAPPEQRLAPRPRHDLFELPVNPIQELADTPAILPVAQPGLFPTARTKLAEYLASASVKPPKPQLKHVQRENRHRFYLWIGLSFVAVWLIIAVVR